MNTHNPTTPQQMPLLLGPLVALAWFGCSNTRSTDVPPNGTAGDSGADVVQEASVDAPSGVDGAIDADGGHDYLWKEGDCVHPKVEKHCENGWCLIPAGCYIIGSPEDEFERGMYTENLTPVTLTHPFHISQTEVTQKQWTSLGLPNPTTEGPPNGCRACLQDDCAVGNVTWFEMLGFANLASEKHGLKPCYELKGCTGKLGEGMVCNDVVVTSPTVYACEGFRLPTEAEWEYAARAGTREANYNGGFGPTTTLQDARRCGGEPSFDPISWNCSNAGGRMHPVGTKMPNQWGLHDVIGNGAEVLFGVVHNNGYGDFPLTDPWGTFVKNKYRVMRGSFCTAWPTPLRVAAHDLFRWDNHESPITFRLARTGAENPGPIAK